METHKFKTKGVCAREVEISFNDDSTIANIDFQGGCPGNAAAINRLVKNMSVKDYISTLEGVKCGNKPTSCVDQVAKILKLFKN